MSGAGECWFHGLVGGLLLAVCIVGCGGSSKAQGSDDGTSGNAGTSGSNASGGASAGASTGGVSLGGSSGSSQGGSGAVTQPDPVDEAIWTEDSEAIAVSWFSYWSGGMRFEKRRDELSAAELELVEDMRTITPNGDCWADAGEASVTVTGSGSAREYFANEFGGTCAQEVTLVTYEPVYALVHAAQCLPAQSYDGSSLATAASVRPDDGCYHGLFNGSGTTPEWWFVLDIAEPGRHRVALDSCHDRQLELTLFDAGGATALASATSTAGTCPVLTHTLAAGTYALHMIMTAGTSGGDFYLRVDSEP